VVLVSAFTDYGALQAALEAKGIETSSAAIEWIPTMTKQLSDDDAEQVIKLIDRLEEDDDVMNVFHTMDMES
jgi:transcriptional/translational regulatory protein YebC/TACO1